MVALAARLPSAQALPTTFDFIGSAFVSWAAPTTATYRIVAVGAGGGLLGTNAGAVLQAGRLGAEIGGDFLLLAGNVLSIAVGGRGSGSRGSNGGGGGSFVLGLGDAPMLFAGGGGGGSRDSSGGSSVGANSGQSGSDANGGGGGADGAGGAAGGSNGGGGSFLAAGALNPFMGVNSWLGTGSFVGFGRVTIEQLSTDVPEPTSIALVGLCLGLAAQSARRRLRS